MLIFVRHIQKVNTENVEPLFSLVENQPLILRDDDPKPNTLEEVLANAKKTHRSYFIVPKGKHGDREET